MKNQNIYQQDCDSNNDNASSGNSFINSHAIYQCNNSSNFKDMNGDVKKDDVSSGYGSMKIHTVYQLNGLK